MSDGNGNTPVFVPDYRRFWRDTMGIRKRGTLPKPRSHKRGHHRLRIDGRELIRNIFIGGSVCLHPNRFTANRKSGEFEDGDYAACRFSYPQRGQASKKLGMGIRHSAQSFSPGSLLRFRCAYGSEPQFAQGSSNSPVLILAPQLVQNVPPEYIPIDRPHRNGFSLIVG